MLLFKRFCVGFFPLLAWFLVMDLNSLGFYELGSHSPAPPKIPEGQYIFIEVRGKASTGFTQTWIWFKLSFEFPFIWSCIDCTYLHLILCSQHNMKWKEIQVQQLLFIMLSVYAHYIQKHFLVFEAGMCISLPVSRKQIAINHLLSEHWHLFFLGAIIWDASAGWENNNIW